MWRWDRANSKLDHSVCGGGIELIVNWTVAPTKTRDRPITTPYYLILQDDRSERLQSKVPSAAAHTGGAAIYCLLHRNFARIQLLRLREHKFSCNEDSN